MADVEKDLGTKLDWVAVDHWNTDNPHVHVLIRGRADDGQDLVISRDYISRGFRDHAAARVTIELASPSSPEIRNALDRQADEKRGTSLDRADGPYRDGGGAARGRKQGRGAGMAAGGTGRPGRVGARFTGAGSTAPAPAGCGLRGWRKDDWERGYG